MADKLKQAIQLIKAGDKDSARQLLIEKLKADPKSDTAWVWLASVVETAELKQECLEEALKHNPHNEVARRALTEMEGRPATFPPQTHQPPIDIAEARSTEVPVRRRHRRVNRFVLPIFLLALIVIALTYVINREELAYRNDGDVINASILKIDKAPDPNSPAEACTAAYQFLAYGALRKGSSAFPCIEYVQVDKSRMIRIEYRRSEPDLNRYYLRPNNADTLMPVGFGLGGLLVIVGVVLLVWGFLPRKSPL